MVTNTEQSDENSFKNNFWNPDYGNFQGFEVLVKRLKDGRSVCKEYVDFLRQRSLIEEQYGKALIKLAKTVKSRDEISQVRPAWDRVTAHTEAVGLNHVQASNQLAAEVTRISEFMESSQDKRKWAEEGVRTLQAQMRTTHKRLVETKRGYETRCREEIQASHMYHQEVSKTGGEGSGTERARVKHGKARELMEQAEEAYKTASTVMEETRSSWQEETENCAEKLQQIETARLATLRDSAWKLTNIGSAYCVADDEMYEDTRQCLEGCDLEEGLKQFIVQQGTGNEKPAPVTCELLPNSSTLGMGHMSRQRQLNNSHCSSQQFDSHSLGRATTGNGSTMSPHTPNTQSLTHLAEIGRSRSDLGYNMAGQTGSYSHSSLHINSKSPSSTKTVEGSQPKKPPRLMQFSKVTSETFPATSVDNNMYYALPDHISLDSSSDRSGELTLDSSGEFGTAQQSHFSPDSTPPRNSRDSNMVQSPTNSQESRRGLYPMKPTPANHGRTSSIPRHQPYSLDYSPVHSPRESSKTRQPFSMEQKAVVLCEYRRNSNSEISLNRNHKVTLLECSPKAKWWRVESESGNQGFFPANFLRKI